MSSKRKDEFVLNHLVVAVMSFVIAGIAIELASLITTAPPALNNLTIDMPDYLKIAWAPFASNYLEILEECCDWIVTDDPHNATMLWLRYGNDEINPRDMRLGRGQLYSLVDGTDIMTDKAQLHNLLVAIKKHHLQPETYVMSNSDECRDFFVRARSDRSLVWVSKESTNSQGDGIIINPSLSDLEQYWLEDPTASNDELYCLEAQDSKYKNLVLQQYIRNPLLLNNKKMEIRSYWLIASLDPFIVFYHDGTVRLTTQDYNENDWNNPLIHITNTAQQKAADPNYYTTESERKWTVQQLGDYLQQHKYVQNGKEYIDETLRPKLMEIISIVSKAAYPYLMEIKHLPGWDGRFELLGMDVILDNKLNMWLTEFQMGPGISRDPGVKEKTLPAMLKEMTDIVLEVDAKLRMGASTNDLDSAVEWYRVF